MAKQLLQEGSQVSMVAENLGFASQSYFSKAFKRETGFTPSDFAKNHDISKSTYSNHIMSEMEV